MKIREFQVNDYITLKLIGDTTNIYINKERFMLCKHLILNIPIEEARDIDEIDSIDEVAKRLGWTGNEQIYNNETKYNIPPEVEFWGHCSNFQVWYENKYDTRLLHSNIAFRLLKKLTEVGDPLAKKVFKGEISERLNSGYDPVIYYLIKEKYTDYLSKEELLFSILEPNEAEVIIKLEEQLETEFQIDDSDENLEWVYSSFSIENRHVIRLQMIGFNLKKLPNCIRNLTHLRYLYMNGNEFEVLPDWLKELINLEVLDLSSCELEVLPEPIVNVLSLRELNLFNNYITELPTSIGNLKHLEKLIIEHNNSLTIPDSFGNLKSLKVLYATRSGIRRLPETIGGLNSIEELHISGNRLTYLPQSIGRLNSLVILDISGNYIKEIPDSIRHLLNLKELLLDSNNLKAIPKSVGELKNLEVLRLSSNSLEEVPIEIFDIPTLKEIRMSQSVLNTIPQYIIRKLKQQKIKL
ncbi:MAG: leucine-rich repeat domain-containing protein [Promethearchaeota archaeon]|nr:MAG: leucine-rich repeat domain-containing protein [Candidatus Lokiarchaeota archaeon]